jgi:tetratricopeptide (TPR) repeat protein
MSAALLAAGTSSDRIASVNELLAAWQLEDALAAARDILANDAENPEVWVMAARVQHQRGEHLSALALLDAARTAGMPDDPHFRTLVETSARYQAHFDRLETPHFSIRYLNKDEIVAYYAAPILESAYQNIAGDLGLLPAERGEKIVVEIYPDARALAGATGLTIHEIETSGTIAVCKFHRLMITSPLATASGYEWGDTLAHEFTHLVISKKSHNTIPIWLHEGIAKYYESRWKGAAGQALSPYSEKLLADAARTGHFISFAQMYPSMAKLPSQEAAALAFAEVFTTVEFLRTTHGSQSISELLDHSRDAKTLEQALQRTFGMGFAKLEARWKRYLKKRTFHEVPGAAPRHIRLATSEGEVNKEKPLEKIEDREIHDFSRLGELLQLRGHHEAAIIEYEKAYVRAGPRYATLINRLARAYLEADRASEALATIDKLLTAHPNDGDAHLLAGRIHLQRKELNAARTHFEAVRLQNPFNPEIHLALSKVYRALGNTKEADQAAYFMRLASKPRPSRIYELPSPPAGNAKVSIVTRDWRPVRINGGSPVSTPAWNVPVNAGGVEVEWVNAARRDRLVTFRIAAGESIIRVVD